MLFSKIKKSNIANSGYSLIELLAVIAIIGIMAAVAVLSYSENKKKVLLDKAVQQMALDLRRVQNMAINTAVFNGSVPSGGYGIYLLIPTNGYTLYADTNGSHQYDGGDSAVIAKTFDYPISVSEVTDSRASINFLPPNPDIYFDGISAKSLPSSNITIILRYGASGPIRKITVNGITGQVSVN